MPTTTITNYSSGLSTTTSLDAGTYSVRQIASGLGIPKHDHITLSYTGSDLTGVVYKNGGSNGSTVGTLTLAYDGSGNLTSVTKS
jgi:hypothetical protein